MNHGFTVDRDSLPAGVTETHVSLFDDSNCGLRLDGKDVFSVQYHPKRRRDQWIRTICSSVLRKLPRSGLHERSPHGAARSRG